MADRPSAAPAAPQVLRASGAQAFGAGSLLDATPLGTVSTQAVTAALVGSRLPAVVPVYEVATYRLRYVTVDGRGQPVVASGLLAVPQKAAGAPSPAISYQHATIYRDAQAPSNNAGPTEPAVVLASLGFVVVAADYVGYGASVGVPHPYLLSAPTAAAVVDLLGAARTQVESAGVALNGQLFLVGYSEGGYATAAAQRLLQARGGTIAAAVVGSAPGAGPLDVGATLDELLRRVRAASPALAALVDPDLLQFLGEPVRRRVRDEMLALLLPGDADVAFQSTFIDNFLANDRAAIRRDSDVQDWRPDTPVRLFHGRDDQTVPFIGSASALQEMRARGAGDVQLAECPATPSDHIECVPAYWSHMLSQIALVVRDL